MTAIQKAREAADRLRENLASFDAEVAYQLSIEGERADLWDEIDVNVEDLRSILAALDAETDATALERVTRERDALRTKLETVEAVSDDMVRHVLTKLDPTWEDDCTAKSRANQRRHMRKTIIAIMDAIRNLEPRHALAAFGPCPHNCDVGGICLAGHAGFPESCARAALGGNADA